MAENSLEKLIQFISTLLMRHRAIHESSDIDQSLVYAEALLQQAVHRDALAQLPKQVVVIGPTQAGKSTLVNLLLGSEVAEANTLAGFTRHGQGFSTEPLTAESSGVISASLPGLKPLAVAELQVEDLSAYSLSQVDGVRVFIANHPVIVWDTPDFDSVNSSAYRTVVPRLCALADIIVLVLSVEKYADHTVWKALRLIGQIERPLIVCLNKTTAETEERLLASVKRKFEQEGIKYTELHALQYQDAAFSTDRLSDSHAENLRNAVARTLLSDKSKRSLTDIKPFFDGHWQAWTNDLRTEHRAAKQWQVMIDTATNEAIEAYQRDYLQNPDYGDTTQRAILRLLELLEVPGAAAVMVKARGVITWPVRTLVGMFKDKMPNKDKKTDHETEILTEAMTHLLTHLQREVGTLSSAQSDENREWWTVLWTAIGDRQPEFEQQIAGLIQQHQTAFIPEIEAAAERLYAHLQKHPAVLNGLRTARVTADTAGILLALKTGGIGVSDLLFTPAMLSLTSMLTEGALGRYMQTVEDELKLAQAASVTQYVIDPLKQFLTEQGTSLDQASLYGIAEQHMLDAEQALDSLTL